MADREPSKNSRLFDPEARGFMALAPSGTLETGELIRLIGGNFENGALPAVTWLTSFINGGTASAINGELILSTNTAVNGEAIVQSVHRAEFVTATFNKAHLAFQCDDWFALDVVRDWGMNDPVQNIVSGDGPCFRNNEGAIEVVIVKGGIEQIIQEVDFNGGIITGRNGTFKKDNNIHTYEIVYNAGRVDFFQDRRLIHFFTSLDAVAYETTHLTLGASVRNINGSIENHTLKTRGFACSRIGAPSAESDSITINDTSSAALKNSPGKLLNVVITSVGIGNAEIELYDGLDATGIPFATLDLTSALIDLDFSRRLDNGLFYSASGAGFEILINWR